MYPRSPRLDISALALALVFLSQAAYAHILVPVEAADPNDPIKAVSLVTEVNGIVWVIAANGLFSIDSWSLELEKRFPTERTEVAGRPEILDIARVWGDDTWIGTDQGVFQIDDDSDTSIALGNPDIKRVSSLAFHGSWVYLGAPGGLFRIGRQGAAEPVKSEPVTEIALLNNGAIAVGTAQELYVLQDEARGFVPIADEPVGNVQQIVELEDRIFVKTDSAPGSAFSASTNAIVEIQDGKIVSTLVDNGDVAGFDKIGSELWYSSLGIQGNNRYPMWRVHASGREPVAERLVSRVPFSTEYNYIVSTKSRIWLGTSAGIYYQTLDGDSPFRSFPNFKNSDTAILGLSKGGGLLWAWGDTGQVYAILEDVEIRVAYKNSVNACGVEILSGRELQIENVVYEHTGDDEHEIPDFSVERDEFKGVLETSRDEYDRWVRNPEDYTPLRDLGKEVHWGPSTAHVAIKDPYDNAATFEKVTIFTITKGFDYFINFLLIALLLLTLRLLGGVECFLMNLCVKVQRLLGFNILEIKLFRRWLRRRYLHGVANAPVTCSFDSSLVEAAVAKLRDRKTWQVVVEEELLESLSHCLAEAVARDQQLGPFPVAFAIVRDLRGASKENLTEGIVKSVVKEEVRTGLQCFDEKFVERIISQGHVVGVFQMASLDDAAILGLFHQRFTLVVASESGGKKEDGYTDFRSAARGSSEGAPEGTPSEGGEGAPDVMDGETEA